MTDAASLADRVREGDLRLHELEAHADADTAAEARADCSSNRSPARRSTRSGTTASPRRPPSPPSRTWSARSRCRWASPAPSASSTAAPSPARSTPPATTTEGALLASVNRGCSVINSAGGATARVLKSGMTRAGVPCSASPTLPRPRRSSSWTRDNFAALKEAAEETTNHGELLDVTPYVVGNSVYLRFRYDTKDAMGMNMATIATERPSAASSKPRRPPAVAPSGNLCSDKKPAAINAVEGRGRSVTADVRIPREVVEERLHTTPEAVAELNTRKNLVGSAKAASLGFNAHVANVVAAMFLATGQDEAQVVEGANAITTAEVQDGDLYVSVSIASLEVGTVGGGTKLPTQSEGLDILGVSGGGDPAGSNADALAECIAVGSLAGELSLPRARLAAPLQRPRRTRSVTAWGLLSDRDS